MSNKRKTPKVNSEGIKSIPEYPAISLRHITTNSSYNLKRVFNDKQLEMEFFNACKKLMTTSYKQLLALSKKTGFETIPFNQVKFSPNSLSISSDQKVYVYRFDSQSKRIVGYKKKRNTIHNWNRL